MSTLSALRTVVERLDYLLPRCVEEFPHLRSEISTLRSSLGAILERLLVADPRKIINIREEYKHQLTDIADSIEDIVELCFLQNRGVAGIAPNGKPGCAFWFLSKYSFSCRGRLIRAEFRSLKMRLEELNPVLAAAAAAGGTDERSRSIAVSSSIIPSRQNPRHALVGMDSDRGRLRSLLLDKQDRWLSFIAICGMAGAGKTTLAQSLYDDSLVVENFDICAWATVTQKFQAGDIMGDLLTCLHPSQNEEQIARTETTPSLMWQLYKVLVGRRYLIVLDDIWSVEAWDILRRAFPSNGNGSRVLITTRNGDVARYITPSILEMLPLTYEESWGLLQSSLGEEVLISRRLVKIAKKVVEYCHGVPLAIHAIAERLSGTISYKQWKRMLYLLQRNETPEKLVDNSFGLSYEDLPYQLQPCFLYLGCFPRDQVIPVEKLYLLWVAERMTESIQVAERCLIELVDRRLVMVVEKEEVSGRIKTCLLHDLMHGLCLRKGKEEGFMKVPDSGPGNIGSPLTSKLAIHLNEFEENDVLLNKPQTTGIRSILFFDTENSRSKITWPTEFSELKSFQRTRVLGFDGVDFRDRKLPTGIGKLAYLRYLSFRGCYLLELPSPISNLRFLEMLDLRVRVSCVITIPNFLWKLSRLRHLYFPLAFRSDTEDKLKLAGLEELAILKNFNPSICDPNDLLQLPKLQILTGIVDGGKLDLDNIIKCMNRIGLLGRSSLVVKYFDSYSKDRRAVAVSVLECNALHALELWGTSESYHLVM
ncbi:UNVERIFIED_CONTAM: putative disease resistance protein RXW24L [Sesamum angustifolium]|uniref:Disease resistance protein RXW24L n=1 Tax=Sesamum angustifolium TaxID=2727405 RepID=A0AAW2KHA3_9LAMI